MRRRIVTASAVVFVLTGAVLLTAAVGGAGREIRRASPAVPKEVTASFSVKPLSLDPDLAFLFSDLGALHLIGGNLYELRGTGNAVPTLASGYSTSANGLKQTYRLRSGLKFSDGSPLTARDVVASVERSINNKSNAYAGFFQPIVSVTASTSRTVVFKLKRPYPSLSTILAEPPFAILPAKDLNVAKGTAKPHFFDKPISAGPYMIRSWGGGSTITFVPNPFYVGPKPVIPLLRFTTTQDFNARVNELRSGQIDVAQSIPPALIPTLQSTKGISVVADDSYGWQTLDMWDGKAPLNNAHVRRAISLAINRDQLAQTVFFGKIPALAGFWPSTMDGHDPSIPTKADIAQAKRLLQGTGCAKGCTLQLLFETDDEPWAEQAAVVIQSNLQAIGIKTNLVHLDEQTMLTRLPAGKYQLAIYGIYDFANVPDGMLAYGLLKAGGLNANFSGYSSPRMDKLASEATESTGAKRQTTLRQINSLFGHDQPFATLSDFFNVYATRLPRSLIWVDAGQFIQVRRKS